MTDHDPTLNGRCLDCNYLLRDLPLPRCPECGRAFDPNDLATMRMPGERRSIAKWLSERLGTSALVVVAGVLLPLVWVFSSPGPYYLGIGFVPLIAAFLVPVIALWPAVAHGGKIRRSRLLLIAVLTLASILFFELPLRIRFALSTPAMYRLLRDYQANPDAPRPERQWVGLFEIGRIDPLQFGGMIYRFYEPDDLEVGFGYSASPIGYAGRNMGNGGRLFGGVVLVQ